MKVLLFLNGHKGVQTGIEDGFQYLLKTEKIKELDWFYYQDYLNNNSYEMTINEMFHKIEKMNPDIIIFFHIGKFLISNEFFNKIRKELPKVIIVYDEGDMYGGLSKPITKSMKIAMSNSNIVSIRGLGSFYNDVSKYNKNIIYTPHHADIARFDDRKIVEKKNLLVMIGNKHNPKINFRLPGAAGREKFVKFFSNLYKDKFKLYGNGWSKYSSNCGPIDFQKQMNEYKKSWITVAYEHYPNVPYYFSNRLPIALLSGSLYVCHYHKGYDEIFKDCDFIFFFKTNEEARDIITYISSLDKNDLIERTNRARNFAKKYFTPEVIWSNFYSNILENLNR